MIVGTNIQDSLVTETARNEAMELYPDSLKFKELSLWSVGPTPDDDLIHVYIGMKDGKGRAEKLMQLAFYQEDLEDGRIVNGLYEGLDKFKKSHAETLSVLSEYWKEQKREEHILKEREKAGTIPVDKDGKPVNEVDKELIANVHGSNNWLSRMRESFEEAYRAEILYPTGHFMPKEGVICPIPENTSLREYKLFDDNLRYEMHDPRKSDKLNYTYKLRTPKMKASLANYYDYIHSQDRAIRKQCIDELRKDVRNAVRGFFRDKQFPDEKTFNEEKKRRDANINAMRLGLNGRPKNQVTKFNINNYKKKSTRTNDRSNNNSNERSR